MSGISTETPESLKKSTLSVLRKRSEDEGFNINDDNPGDMLRGFIEALYRKYNQKVVVLVDEYDKPILDHIMDLKTADANRQALRGLYGVLKSMDPCLRFVFITGVSKFIKTSIFSSLNNIKDITMAEPYAGICGIPIESLEEYFGEHMEGLKGHKRFIKYDNVYDQILAWYDGYTWDDVSRLLNPYSLLNFFDDKKFMNYWYVSGMPWFLIDLIKMKPESYLNFKNYEVTEWMMDALDIQKIDIEPLLFQTGYLTVKEVIETMGPPVYVLDFPNFEVRDAFNIQILAGLTESGETTAGHAQREIRGALENGDPRRMLEQLRGLFASIPYNLRWLTLSRQFSGVIKDTGTNLLSKN